MARRSSSTELGLVALTIEGGLIAPEQVQKILAADRTAKPAESYACPKGTSLGDEIARYFRIGQAIWRDYDKADAKTVTRTAAFARDLLAQCLGFTDLHGPVEHCEGTRRYRLAWEAKQGRVPIVAAAPVTDGDAFARSQPEFGDGEGGRPKRSPAALLQDWLNANPSFYWGLVFAGDRVRLMRDNASLTRPAWIEADLGAMFRDEMFADFTAFWLLAHATRFGAEGAAASDCALEQWREAGLKQGVEARKDLYANVATALEELGQGLVEANPDLRDRLQTGTLSMQALFEELLRTVYRLIFLAVAEDRDLLHPRRVPLSARQLYSAGYSFTFWRERSRRRVARDAHYDAWEAVKVTLASLEHGEDMLGLPALGGLFAISSTPNLNAAKIPNRAFLSALFCLGFIRKDGVTHRINWRDLKTEELGSVYEGLLEIRPSLSAAGLFQLGTGAKGNDRKTSGSYYTPDSLVECLLDSALVPVLDRAEAGGATAEEKIKAILALKVIDPACGSGHFLLGAARRMATRVARLRNEDAGKEETQAALRDVVSRCIHGVDRNPMAVELAKVALWIESVSPGQPLGFLDANLRCGDALLGVFDLAALEEGIPDEAYKPLTGDNKEAAKFYRERNKDAKKGQGQLDFLGGGGAMPPRRMAAGLGTIKAMPEETVGQVEKKRAAFEAWKADPARWNTQVACDLYMAAFLLPKMEVPASHLRGMVPTTAEVRQKLAGGSVYGPLEAAGVEAARFASVLHWPLEFPDVVVANGGFDVVLGNPPFANAIENDLSEARGFQFLKFRNVGVKGAADYSARFLGLGSELSHPRGSVGMVLPRIILNSPTTHDLRIMLGKSLPPAMIYCPPERHLFEGATIDIALLNLRDSADLKVSRSPIGTIEWKRGLRESENWWSLVSTIWENRSVSEEVGNRIGDLFEVFGSMTTADAYDIREFIEDSESGDGQKLVTTGLIDPGVNYWGQEICRYLKAKYQFPRVADRAGAPNSIYQRISKSRRPKIIVAGLSNILEAFLDAQGEYIGAVATFTIQDPEDNIERLRRLIEFLHSEAVLQRLKDELGGNALGGGAMTMKKGFLLDLRLPEMTTLENLHGA